MRSATDKAKLLAFMREVGLAANGRGRIYIVGGSSALLLDIREQTIDIDIKLDPEPTGVFEAIAKLKERLDVSIELASPDQFIPALSGWRERSEFITLSGVVEFYHYDFYGQALAKILRGHANDLSDAHALIRLGKVDKMKLQELFGQIQGELVRYPAVDRLDFENRLGAFLSDKEGS